VCAALNLMKPLVLEAMRALEGSIADTAAKFAAMYDLHTPFDEASETMRQLRGSIIDLTESKESLELANGFRTAFDEASETVRQFKGSIVDFTESKESLELAKDFRTASDEVTEALNRLKGWLFVVEWPKLLSVPELAVDARSLFASSAWADHAGEMSHGATGATGPAGPVVYPKSVGGSTVGQATDHAQIADGGATGAVGARDAGQGSAGVTGVHGPLPTDVPLRLQADPDDTAYFCSRCMTELQIEIHGMWPNDLPNVGSIGWVSPCPKCAGPDNDEPPPIVRRFVREGNVYRVEFSRKKR
jgi:hypothetical protein